METMRIKFEGRAEITLGLLNFLNLYFFSDKTWKPGIGDVNEGRRLESSKSPTSSFLHNTPSVQIIIRTEKFIAFIEKIVNVSFEYHKSLHSNIVFFDRFICNLHIQGKLWPRCCRKYVWVCICIIVYVCVAIRLCNGFNLRAAEARAMKFWWL